MLLMNRNRMTDEGARQVLEEVEVLRGRYDEEPSHSEHVEKLALHLYDELAMQRAVDFIGTRERLLLQSATLLHDIGWSQSVDGKGHHKYSARLIRGHGWTALNPDEVAVVALVARYHRKSLPKASHKDFADLPADLKRLVRYLGGILRVADGLDRTHSSVVTEVGCELSTEALTVRVRASRAWEEERRMFNEKKDLLQLALERLVRVEG